MTGSKRIMRITAGLLCLLMIFSAVSALAETKTIRNGYMVRLRATPSSKGKVLDAFPVGTRVNVLSKGDTWCKVRVSGKTGYMMTKYLYSGSGSSGGGSGTTKYVWTPTGTTLNLRSEPNSWSAILGSYRVGTRVTVLKSGRMWSRVSVNGKIGYMYSYYLVNSR
ncbi:MAG: SH3 domain-containing protein [Clostridiales bacterium]|nr:SH3 domain-containing protein [Clostridiales bacterium]